MYIIMKLYSAVEEGELLDDTTFPVPKFDHKAVMQVSTQIAEWMERGLLPIDNWQPFVAVKCADMQPMQFYSDIISELETYVLDV